MKHPFLYVILALCVVFVASVSFVNLSAPDEYLPPPDPSLGITMPDGRVEPLGELLERFRSDQEQARAAAELSQPDQVNAEESSETELGSVVHAGESRRAIGEITVEINGSSRTIYENPVFSLARYATREGRYDEALALFRSIGPDDEDYSNAQRFIGWDLLTKEQGQASRAVSYVNRALMSDPFDGNGWQDASRVYARTLGIAWD